MINVVPRDDGQSSLGTADKKWKAVYADDVVIGDKSIKPALNVAENLDGKVYTKTEVDEKLAQAVDYVIAYAYGLDNPDNHYMNGWWRLYKSGWLEQGGLTYSGSASDTKTITLPIPYAGTNFQAVVSNADTSSTASATVRGVAAVAVATNELRYYFGGTEKQYRVCGVANVEYLKQMGYI